MLALFFFLDRRINAPSLRGVPLHHLHASTESLPPLMWGGSVSRLFLWCSSPRRRSQHRYQIVAAEAMEGLAERLEELHPDRFRFHKTSWGKFPDGTDNIEVGAVGGCMLGRGLS